MRHLSPLILLMLASLVASPALAADNTAHPAKKPAPAKTSKAAPAKASAARANAPAKGKVTRAAPAKATPAPTITPTSADHLATGLAQRDLYRQALAAKKAGRFDEYRGLVARLRDYPIYPYLRLDELGAGIGDLPFDEVHAFATRYQSSPAGQRMSYGWLRAQATPGRWQNLIDHYAPGQISEEFDCLHYRAHLAMGNTEEAFKGAATLWSVPYPQNDACNELFDAWQKQHPITEKMAWKRLTRAYANEKPQLAAHLETYLGAQRRAVATAWREVYSDPARLSNVSRYHDMGTHATAMIANGLARLAVRDYQKAADLWGRYRDLPFTRGQRAQVLLQIGKFMMVNFDPAADCWLNEARVAGAKGVATLALRSALRQQDWERAQRWLALGDEKEANQWVWQYWRARTDQWLGTWQARQRLARPVPPYFGTAHNVLNLDRPLSAAIRDPYRLRELFPTRVKALLEESAPPRTGFEIVAKERNFYGFLASERLGKPLSLNSTHYSLDGKLSHTVRNSEALNRAIEFAALGQDGDARRELYFALKFVSEDEKIAAALLAHQFGWHLHAIQIAQQSEAQNDLGIRFPLLYTTTIQTHSRDAAISPDWTYAIIRQESGFWQEALSPVGAIGFMQLMPGTAKLVAKSLNMKLGGPRQIADPNVNIRLGTTYLGQLSRQLDDNPVLATAGYNAGPGRARRWQPKDAPMPGDVWVETIPYTETREYVKNVMSYQAIYRHMMGKKAELSPSLKYIPVAK